MSRPRGHLYYAYGAWHARISCGTDPITGQRAVVERKLLRGANNAKDKRHALKLKDQLLVDVDTGKVKPKLVIDDHKDHVTRTVGDGLDAWLDAKTADLKLGTVRRYTYEIHKIKTWPIGKTTIGDLLLARVDASHWNNLFEGMRRSGLDTDTVFSHYSTVRAALNWMMNQRQWIDSHPVGTRITVAYPRNAEVKIPPIEDLKLLFKTARLEDPAWELWLRIAASFGARRGSIAGLHLSDLDLDAGYITFVCAISEGNKNMTAPKMRPLEECLLKADNPYTASIEAPLIPLLEAQLERRRTDLLAMGYHPYRDTHGGFNCGHPDGGWHLFTPNALDSWKPSQVTKNFRVTADRAGLEYMKLHHLKHFAVSTMLKNGVPISIVAQRVGTTEAMILRRYRRFIRGADSGAADIMGNELFD